MFCAISWKLAERIAQWRFQESTPLGSTEGIRVLYSCMCSPLCSPRPALLGVCLFVVLGCQAPEERRVQYDERFERTKMDVYLPSGDALDRPAILTVHGGAWTYFDNRSYRSVARRFARSGYVVANMNYRLVPDRVFPNSPHDVACARAHRCRSIAVATGNFAQEDLRRSGADLVVPGMADTGALISWLLDARAAGFTG